MLAWRHSCNYHHRQMARVSSGRAFKNPPRGFKGGRSDFTVTPQALTGNRAHNTYATESDYDRDGEFGSIAYKANRLSESDFEDVLDGGQDFERDI